MNGQTEPRSEGRYQGRFAAPAKRRGTGRRALVLLILLLSLARLGAEAMKLLAYGDIFLKGGRMLIYGDLEKVDLGDKISDLPVYEAPPEDPSQDYVLKLDDGATIVYGGHTYELNRDLSTVLFMGIDQTITETDKAGTGGQSDVLLLVGIDTVSGQTTVLNISRESYAQVDVYSGSNKFIETRFEQIALAYAYGNGKQTSAENVLRSVSRLLYGMPISSYVVLDMKGIQAANDTLGGVSLKSLIDVRMPDGSQVKEGDLIELRGKNLDRYIRTRSDDVDANAGRMLRQMQYATEFAKKVVRLSRQKLSFPVELFSTLSGYMVTDLNIPDVTFLSSAFLTHGANFSFRSIDGTYDLLNGSSVYYLDEIDLFEAFLQVFYKRVD